MDIVTLGAALNGSAEYVNSHFKGGSNIQIVDNPDGTQTINASGEVSSEDTVAREAIAEMKDGETLDSFGDVETALDSKQNTISDLATIRSGAALGATAVQPETGKGLSANDYTDAEKTKLAGIAEGAEVNVQADWNQTDNTADDYIKNKPTLGTAAAKNATDTYNATGTDVTTGKAVAEALATLPEPMVFQGSLGTGGTVTTLPTASSSNKGYTYKVITAGTYASQSAKVGDTFISDGSAWVLIPSGDEPSGTVTNVAVANGGGLTVSGSPITSSGTITVGHSNSVTAETSSSVKKFTYDAYGHVTGSSELSTAESNALASGITSTDVAQITTNKNNILIDEKYQGGVNLLEYSSLDTTNANGCTYTINDDKSITINRTATSSNISYVIFKLNNTAIDVKSLCDGNHYLVGCPTGGLTTTYRMYATGGSYFVTDYGNGVLLSDASSITPSINIVIRVESAYQASNLTFKPMIITKANYDAGYKGYQPYALPNTAITPALQESVDNGAKNALNLAGKTLGLADGFTGQINSDGTVTISGTTAVTVSCRIELGSLAGSFVLSGCPSGGGDSTYRQDIRDSSYNVIVNSLDNGSGSSEFTMNSGSYLYFRFAAGTYTNVTFKPMLCSKAAWDASHNFEPYAMSNAELTNNILSLTNPISGGVTWASGYTPDTSEVRIRQYGNIVCGQIYAVFANALPVSTETTVGTITGVDKAGASLRLLVGVAPSALYGTPTGMAYGFISSSTGNIVLKTGANETGKAFCINFTYTTADPV